MIIVQIFLPMQLLERLRRRAKLLEINARLRSSKILSPERPAMMWRSHFLTSPPDSSRQRPGPYNC